MQALERQAPSRESSGAGTSRYVLIALGAVILVLALAYGIPYLLYAVAHQTTDDAEVEADTVLVTSKISEPVVALYTDTNQLVHKGQLLMQLDDRDERTRVNQQRAALNAQLAQARAADETVALTQAQQTAQNAENAGGITQSEAQVANSAQEYVNDLQQLSVAQAAVPAARAALDQANADYERTRSLVRSGDQAKADLDAARAAQANAASTYRQDVDRVTAAEATAKAAKAMIGSAQGQLQTSRGKLAESSTPYRVTQQEAQVQAALAQAASLRSQLKTAQDQLSYTRIYAPTDGYVGQKNVEIGQMVAPGTSLLTIVPNAVYITANFKETQVGAMKPGQDVDITIDAYPGTKFKGHVAAIGPAAGNQYALVPAQNATGNFVKVTQRIPVRIAIDDPPAGKPLRPGMSAETSVAVK